MQDKEELPDLISAMFRHALFGRRAEYYVWLQFNISRQELRLLMACIALHCLEFTNKLTKNILFSHITGNNNQKRMMTGAWLGCLSKGYIEEIESKNGQKSARVSALGLRILEAYNKRINEMENKARQRRIKRSGHKAVYLPKGIDYDFRQFSEERREEIKHLVNMKRVTSG